MPAAHKMAPDVVAERIIDDPARAKAPPPKRPAPKKAVPRPHPESLTGQLTPDLIARKQALRAELARLEALAEEGDEEAAEALDQPVFDEDEPYGLVVGEHEAMYVQNGHEFGKDKRYLRTEKNLGTPRAFDPRKVGMVRKPKIVTVDD